MVVILEPKDLCESARHTKTENLELGHFRVPAETLQKAGVVVYLELGDALVLKDRGGRPDDVQHYDRVLSLVEDIALTSRNDD